MDKILVVDDNPSVCSALTILLELHDYQVVTVSCPADAMPIIMYQSIALVLLDMNFTQDTTSGEEGKKAFYQFRQLQPDLPVILLTAWTDLTTAIELVKNGAADYLAKPWDDEKLLVTIANLIELNDVQQTSKQLSKQQREREQLNHQANLCGLVFASTAMQRLVDMTVQVAKSTVNVLITGPNGVGKEKIADILHQNSPRAHQPFIKVNVGALPLDLMEAELFGAEAGAYTGANKKRIGRFEAADGGTLFLDEIGNLSLSGQMKLLRVLQTGEFERLGSSQTQTVDVRVISATNANLHQDIQEGNFREDLYYRLNVIELEVLALSQRKDDILPLVEYFTQSQKVMPKHTKQALLAHQWPGNVRELENACQRAALLSQTEEWQAQDFGLTPVDVEHNMSEFEETITKAMIEQAIAEHHGVISRAAKALGLSRQALYRRMDKFEIKK
ncbi:sigma-54-dependent Fis family transcriptional regulator [Thalassotalea insulae]|uniref:Sigma-54-dependent Fis family transcriptional regulator n=1 Tax=Thalassotalea insulae TaxID=2056778 RepID=A0ABQ6GVU0_9GAMM|nr:sigma-54 dependent transcriptional regulator [Thalassotalea insulae]GLX79492.1 sigma-54-dependent Fis family transcriptional regulator [Thalassotalea insulae]